MPKRYYCEFCQKSFQDTVKSRKNHLKGFSHQRNRKAYYDSALALSPPPASHVLYTNLRGADILQQWLAKHPEVARKHQAFNEGERALADAGTDDKSTSQSGRGKSLQSRSPEQSADAGIPVELQPYRDILPPSLLPPALRRPFTVAKATGDWG